MWQLILEELVRQAESRAAKGLGKWAGRNLFSDELNKPEAYADRINREFNLRNYAKAWALYDSDRAYWEKLYGDDPVTSRNHPASPPSSLLPPQSPDPSNGLFDPSPMGANAFGPFGSGGQFVPGATTSLRPSDGSASSNTIDDGKPVRHLGVRIGETPGATVFDSGAPAVPFVSPSPIPRPGRPAPFNERFPASVPPTSAWLGAGSFDELEAFRRQWVKAFMEP